MHKAHPYAHSTFFPIPFTLYLPLPPLYLKRKVFVLASGQHTHVVDPNNHACLFKGTVGLVTGVGH